MTSSEGRDAAALPSGRIVTIQIAVAHAVAIKVQTAAGDEV
ncbi:hypothetical protein ACFWHQ_37640 [Streptomyces sp. NPDC060334]